MIGGSGPDLLLVEGFEAVEPEIEERKERVGVVFEPVETLLRFEDRSLSMSLPPTRVLRSLRELLRLCGLLVDPPADDVAFEARLVFMWSGSDGWSRDAFGGETPRLPFAMVFVEL